MILRPHHLLCINFFIGKGYSEEFVLNMTNVVHKLTKEDPVIIFKSNNDQLCKSCLNYINGKCITEKKVQEYDNKVLELLNLEKEKEYKYSEIQKEVVDKILTKVLLEEICVDCCWKDICYKLQKERYKL